MKRRLAIGALVATACALWLLAWVSVGRSAQGLLALAPLLVVTTGLILVPTILLVTSTRGRLVAAGCCGLLLIPLLPLLRNLALPDRTDRAGVRVLEWNTQGNPGVMPGLEAAVAETSPDLVVLVQASRTVVDTSGMLDERYPYRADTGDEGAATYVLLLSTYPITASRIAGVSSDGPGSRILVAEVSLPGGPATVVGMHPPRPLTAYGSPYATVRDPQLADLRTTITTIQATGARRLIVTGDLNVTPREAAFDALLEGTGLVDAADWPAWSTMGTWRPTVSSVPSVLPLDHVLHSPCFHSAAARVLWGTGGSQHAPLVAVLRDEC